MKNKIKKLKLPLNKMTGNEKDYAAVLLEDVNSNMKVFWETLSGTQDKVNNLAEEMIGLKDAVADNSIEIAEIRTELKADIKSEISGLKTEIKDEIMKTNNKIDLLEFKIENMNKEKADPKKFLELEKRVIKLEVKAIAG